MLRGQGLRVQCQGSQIRFKSEESGTKDINTSAKYFRVHQSLNRFVFH